ncbi:LysR family transcriptional regulator [Burkholderia sp. Bp9031]|uniref:LysR family transcriptional regulator n=1 Tax=Burkholderia sp. Bp9031 TaxID=2184566 RepID=UPI000F6024DD|nr:LysR family transcriptional regulator [Burkholderia sp. Bp9031]RQZ19719.1 LysR family transcriptional regulator [Burkholderia sp. Bp9031]
MNISLRQIRAFIAVARHGGFTEAARELHLTQSATSLLIKELENELGMRLFDRTTRKVTLTQLGEEFVSRAQRVLDELESAVRDVSDLAALKRGIVKVCTPQTLATTLLAPAMAAFRHEHPEIVLRLIDSRLDTMLRPLMNGETECVVGPDVPIEPHIERQSLFDSPYVLWCRQDHRLATRRVIHWSELGRDALIVMGQDFATRVQPVLREASVEIDFKTTYEVAYMTTALGMASAGLGVTIAPAFIAPLARAFELKAISIQKPKILRAVSIFTRRDKSLSPAAAAFLEFLREFAVKQQRAVH